MLFDRYAKTVLALIAVGLVSLMKPARRCCECAYQRGFEQGYQQGRSKRGPCGPSPLFKKRQNV